jgi:hypothetical protein
LTIPAVLGYAKYQSDRPGGDIQQQWSWADDFNVIFNNLVVQYIIVSLYFIDVS